MAKQQSRITDLGRGFKVVAYGTEAGVFEGRFGLIRPNSYASTFASEADAIERGRTELRAMITRSRLMANEDALRSCEQRIREEQGAISILTQHGLADGFDMRVAVSELQHQTELRERLIARLAELKA